jgi:hypothetical protein
VVVVVVLETLAIFHQEAVMVGQALSLLDTQEVRSVANGNSQANNLKH